jgi:hypothetical protein
MTQETPEETNRRLRLGVYPPITTLRDSLPEGRRSTSGPGVVLALVAVCALLAMGLLVAVLLLRAG